MKGDKRVDLKEFRRNNGIRVLSFASAKDLMEIMNLIPGAAESEKFICNRYHNDDISQG